MYRLFLFLMLAPWGLAGDWLQWAGPDGNFIVKDSPGLIDQWSDEGPPVLWRRSLGKGYSGIVVHEGRLYTSYKEGDNHVVVCLSAENGKTLWSQSHPHKTHEGNVLRFFEGSQTTPLLIDDKVVTIDYGGVMNAWDMASGKLAWTVSLIDDLGGKVQKFGYAASPIAYKGMILALVGGKAGVIGFSPENGQVVWRSPAYDISYASPNLVRVGGMDHIVFFGDNEVRGIAVDDGRSLWQHPVTNQYQNNATSVIWNGSLLWAATQLDGGTRALTLKREGNSISKALAWENQKVKIHYWNAVLLDQTIYCSSGGSKSFLSAVDYASGKILWRERGVAEAKLLSADGKLIFLDAKGKLGMIQPNSKKAKLIANFQLFKPEVTRTIPTLSNGVLFARDHHEIVALNLKK